MAVKEKILEVLAAQTEPIKLKRLGELLGEPITNFQSQVNRMVFGVGPPLVLRNENKEYIITEEGRKAATAEPDKMHRVGNKVTINLNIKLQINPDILKRKLVYPWWRRLFFFWRG